MLTGRRGNGGTTYFTPESHIVSLYSPKAVSPRKV